MWEHFSDEGLMQRVAREDVAAFDALFLRHRSAVFNYTFRMVDDRSLADDLTQECFLRAWRARHGYQPTAAFRTWLFTIARRLTLDTLKSRAAQTSILAEDFAEMENQTMSVAASERLANVNPQDILMARERALVLEEALHCLPAELREVVILRDMEGMRYDEIAQLLGCPLGTLKWRLNAARGRLRRAALEWLGEE